MREVKEFTHSIARLELTELETAIALLWFFAREGRELNAREIAELMQTMGLRGAINISRLSKSLSKSRQVVSAKPRVVFDFASPTKHAWIQNTETLFDRFRQR